MPDTPRRLVSTVRNILYSFDPTRTYLCIEQSRARAGNSMQSVETFMRHYGILLGAILSVRELEISNTAEINPQAWQGTFKGLNLPRGMGGGRDERRKATKRHSRAIASSIFPQHAMRMDTVSSDGLADALLICAYTANLASNGWLSA